MSSSGTCKVCGGRAIGSYDIESNTARDRAECLSSRKYIWTCDRCNTSFHADQTFPTTYDYHCPNCGTHMVYNQNKGIEFDQETINNYYAKKEKEKLEAQRKKQREIDQKEQLRRQEILAKQYRYQENLKRQESLKNDYYKKRLFWFGWMPTINWSEAEADTNLRKIYINNSFLTYLLYCMYFFITSTTDKYSLPLNDFPSFTLKFNYFVGFVSICIVGGIIFFIGVALLYFLGIISSIFS
jgi:predicted RNA-binding Zn-ribbon protein involved in translation (DUF1610 family)